MSAEAKGFALCIRNRHYRAGPIPGNAYRILPDARAAKNDLVWISDEGGEDYLYHMSHSVFVDSPQAAKKHADA